MRQLTGLDAQFLALETPRQSGHVAGLPCSTRAPRRAAHDAADVQALVAERLPLLPPFRWRLVEVPLGLDYPYWIDDPDFDLDYHVRELALPRADTDAKLAEQVARIFARPLDRARPLWELYLIHGLEGGHVALLTKIHHAAIDGMSGAEILGALLDLEPGGPRAAARGHAATASAARPTLEMLGRGLLGLPALSAARGARAAANAAEPRRDPAVQRACRAPGRSGAPRRAAQQAVGRERGAVLERTELTPPRTSFNGRVSPHRRFAFGQLALDAVKAVKNEHGCTVNDVVVALCAGAVRRWLIEHDELPDEPLVAQIPISVRTERAARHLRQPHLLMSAPLFTNEADPVERLMQTHEAMRGAEGAPPGAARRAAPGRDRVHPAGGLRAGVARRRSRSASAAQPSDLEPRDLQRARAAVPAVLRRGASSTPTTRSR